MIKDKLFNFYYFNRDKSKPLITVWLLTFNHELFIKECLNGIFDQKTSFDFEILIGDDCSTDNTFNIIKELSKTTHHPITIIRSRTNLWKETGTDLALKLYSSANGKYIALCEGDDYWNDPNKLQKQVDFLENNPVYSLCSSDYNIKKDHFSCIGILSDKFKNSSSIDYEIDSILNNYLLKTCSVVFKKAFLSKSFYENPGGDVVIFSHILSNGKGVILKDITSTYRIHSEGSYSSKSEIEKVLLDYNELNIINLSNIKIKGLNIRINLLESKIIDLIDINLSNSNTQDFENLNTFLKNKNFYFYKSLHYNYAKAILKYKFKSIHIYKHASVKHFFADIPYFFKSPKLLNTYCIFIFILFWTLYILRFSFSKNEN